VKVYCRRSASRTTMKQNALLLILALCFVISPALGQQEAGEPLAASNAAANASELVNSSIPSGEQFSMVNIFQVAEENPIDPKLGYLRKEVLLGKNASVNMTLYMPGISSGAHYHSATDEIDYVVMGQANLTMNGKDYPVKAGDLIYIPPFNVHDYRAAENDTFQIMVFFVPALAGNDRVYV
ncbi:MAG: cupin domain-containing protein, partial [Methanothrix sp.]